MPLITDEPVESMSQETAAQIPGWLFEHGRLGYQMIRGTVFVYRLPTLRECLLYHKASAHHAVNAGRVLLGSIGKTSLPPRTRPQDVAGLITDILNEAFPGNDQENKLLYDIRLEKASYNLLLAKALEPHVKFLDINKSVWDMSYPELIEALALKELITGEGIEDKKKRQRARQAQRAAAARHHGQPAEVRRGPGQPDHPGQRGQDGPGGSRAPGQEAPGATA